MEWRTPYQNCPLCNCTSFYEFKEGDCSNHALYQPSIPKAMVWMKCDECGHEFTEGYWTEEALKVIFVKTHDNQQPGYDIERQRYVSAKMVDRIIAGFGWSWMPNDGAQWLDVGFGNASLLFTAGEYGFHPVGLDLRQASVDRLKEIGIEAHCADIADFNPPGRDHGTDAAFSVVSMADVLEHMPFPRRGLEAARRCLVRDGLLFVSLPAADSPLWQIMTAQDANPYWGELEHYHNFSRERLFETLRQSGFMPISYGVSERYRCCMEVVARAV